MSVIRELPRETYFRPTLNIFAATYNSPTIGFYDFGIAANTQQEVLPLNPGSLYFVSLINFGANIDPAAYFGNLATTPKLDLRLKQGNAQVFGAAYALGSYLVNNEISAFFWTTQESDTLVATMSGTLSQNADLSGITDITARVAFNIYEITDRAYITKFMGNLPAAENMTTLPDDLKERF